MHRVPDAVVGVVVEVGPRGNDPVHETCFHERDEGGGSKARRGQCTGKGQSDRDVIVENLLGEKLARLSEAAGVISVEAVVDQLRHRPLGMDEPRIDLGPMKIGALFTHPPTPLSNLDATLVRQSSSISRR